MKRFISVTLALSMAAGLSVGLTGCGKKYDGEISVYNFGEYIDEDILDQFSEEYNIRVNYKTYDTCEAMYSVMKNGGADYDVIITSDYMIDRMIKEDMLETIDTSSMENYSKLSDDYKNLAYDPESNYSVVYMWGTVGMIYNTAEISEDLDSWAAMFDEKYSGNILMFESSRDAMAIALEYLGYSVNTTDEAELKAAYELLEQQKPLVQGYFQDQMYSKLETSEATIGAYYAGDYLMMLENNPDLKFVLPKEGSNKFFDAMVIPKGAANKDNAQKFIDFMCRTDIAEANMEATGYASPNQEACDAAAAEMDDYTKSVMFPSSEQLAKCEVYTNLPEATLELYDKYWVDLKS